MSFITDEEDPAPSAPMAMVIRLEVGTDATGFVAVHEEYGQASTRDPLRFLGDALIRAAQHQIDGQPCRLIVSFP